MARKIPGVKPEAAKVVPVSDNAPAAPSPIAEKQSSFPDIPEQEFFRLLVLSEHTELAEGVRVGQLLMLAQEQNGVDWRDVYLTLTVEGNEVGVALARIEKEVSGFGKPIQAMFMRMIRGVYES